MERSDFYRLIDLPPQITEALEAAGRETDLKRLSPQLEGLLDIKTAPAAYRRLRELLLDDPDGFKMLYCHLECARRAYDGYRQRGIPDQVYTDTMRCFPRFLRESYRERGRMVFDRAWWSYRQTSMALFRLGALEYEFTSHKGVPALALHIPSDADFSPEAVDDSLTRARRFFQAFFPDFHCGEWICNSWLLSPALRPLLHPGSHILSFQDRFRIRRENPDDREFIQWLFQVPADTEYAHLPEHTSLQRGVKALLLHNGAVGCAFGVLEQKPMP